ncbi:MAG: metallophosphoesterase [Acidobacteria bacterium]|nr:metallophosphoesterase [Acidobacteriota bacterium]
MSAADAAAERLHALYVEELERVLAPPVHPMVNERQTRALIRMAHAARPGVCEAPDATTWIWSDLHLGHKPSLGVFFRPFGTVGRADEAMMDTWYDLVGADDTIICLGDVSVDGSVTARHQRWWREAPGVKWLVLGNHDVDPVNRVRPVAVDRTAVTLFAPGEPPLLLTHVPLMQVPHGWVNVHGHVHQKESPSRHRHINVSVEQLNYRPAKLSDIRRLARRLVEGRIVPGHSTRARLNLVERVMP